MLADTDQLAISQGNLSPTGTSERHHSEAVAVARKEFNARRRAQRALSAGAFFSPLAVLLLWEFLSRTKMLNPIFFPAPSQIFGTFWKLVSSGLLARHMAATASRVAIGYALGVIPGVVVGLVLGIFTKARVVLAPVISALYVVPKIAIFPLILVIFGIGDTSKWVIVAIGAFFLAFFNTLTGVIQTPRIYLDVAQNVGASKLQFFRTVAWPSALPNMFTGLRLAVGTSFIVIAAAEFVGSKSGVGWMIWTAWQTLSVSRMFVGIIAISFMGYVAQLVIELIGNRATRWSGH